MTALSLLALLSAIAVLASDLARQLAWPGAVLVLVVGASRARREQRRPACLLLLGVGGPDSVDGQPVHELRCEWRGALAFVRWRDADGRRQRRSFWPDTLPPARRRELRLATSAPDATPGAGGMAH